ncbi:MAG TPA: nuclear transport factor 2 family protein [Ktedonobacteraceae bacterium]|nr:nuclear transport factor 2 family protein [Ktedonobacteraceae bacterium]
MNPVEVVQASIQAWENNDAEALAACLADDFFCVGQMPQRLDKRQFIDYMKSMMRAFPDWKFNQSIVNTRDNEFVEVCVRVTGTNTGEIVILGLAPIPPTDKAIALPPEIWEYDVRGDQIVFLATNIFNTAGGFAGILNQLGMELPTYPHFLNPTTPSQ